VYTKLAVLRSDMYAEANRRQCPRRAGHRARLSRDECKRVEARELLQSTAGSPIHRGLDTLDLNEAKALLDTLEAFSACAVISGSLAMSAAIGRASSRVRCGPR
jgi:hypothetical protein